MPYTFRIIFGGLCAIVPGDDHLDVLLVNTENERTERLRHPPELHRPQLAYFLANLPGGGNPEDPKEKGFWPLEFDDLTVTAKTGEGVTVTARTSTGPEYRQHRFGLNEVPMGVSGQNGGNPGQGSDDLAWIPHLKTICPAIGTLETDCLSPKPRMDSKKAFVKARLRIDRGLVRVFEVASYNGKDVLVDYLPKFAEASVGRAAIPHLAAVEMSFNDDEIATISIARFDGTRPGELQFVPSEDEPNEVSIYLTNLCCGGYYDRPSNEMPAADTDFECFYTLVDNFETELSKHPGLPIPIPVDFEAAELNSAAGGGGGGLVKCTMTRIDRS